MSAVKLDTVTIEIDGNTVSVPKGSMIIEATDQAGISIPRFCYHKKLSIAANCRMCLVEVEKAPKPMPACATPVIEGMKIRTQSNSALDAQQSVMEFLLINHPLDCPICDQGGECELQDVAMGYGRSVSRFTETKRSVSSKNIGSLIATDMTRCIHCTRCVRFLEEIAGSTEMGGFGRGENTEIGTYIQRSIDSEISANIIDVCPVGALTNKPFRYSARAWELTAKKSIGFHDGVGSNLYLHTLRGKIKRVVPRNNDAINENWISDRDRFSFEGLYSDDRLQYPQIKRNGQWERASLDEALSYAADCIKHVCENHGSDQLGYFISPNSSCEELFLSQKLVRSIECPNIDSRLRLLDTSDQSSINPAMSFSIQSLETADAILIVGSNLRLEQPLIAHRVRKAWLNQGSISVINSYDYKFHFDVSEKQVVNPRDLVDAVAAIAKHCGANVDPDLRNRVKRSQVTPVTESLVKQLQTSDKGVILLGELAANHPIASVIRSLASSIASQLNVSFCEINGYANSVGAHRVGAVPFRSAAGNLPTVGMGVKAMLDNPRKGYVLHQVEAEFDTAHATLASSALSQAERVIVISTHASETTRNYASVLLPSCAPQECEGSYVNLEGESQSVKAGAKAPDEARPAWKLVRVIANKLELKGFDYLQLDQVTQDLTLQIQKSDNSRSNEDCKDLGVAKGLLRIVDVPAYQTDIIVRRSNSLAETVIGQSSSNVGVSTSDAARLKMTQGELIKVRQGAFEIEAKVHIDEKAPLGGVYMPLNAYFMKLASINEEVHLEKVADHG